MLTRRSLIGSIAASVIAPAAWAQDAPVYFATEGAAIAGFDAVTYFSGDAPLRGQPGISVTWKGAEWHFTSQENRDRFEMNPRAYAPQFGGYCAYAMAGGVLKSTDPQAWQVVDGRLYLTHSPLVERMWRQNRSEFIRQAEANWPGILYAQ